MKELFLIQSGSGVMLVHAESAEKALTMAKEPALAEIGLLSAEVQAEIGRIELEPVSMDSEIIHVLSLMGYRVLTDTVVMAAVTSVEAFKDESLKLFSSMGGRFIVAAKDRADAVDIITQLTKEASHSLSGDLAGELVTKLAEQDTPRSEFERPPKMLSRRTLEWYKSQPPPELPMMPIPPYVM